MGMVEVRTFQALHEAEMVVEFLKANGIESQISGYDRMRPHLNFSMGVKLMVNESDVEKAQDLLEARIK